MGMTISEKILAAHSGHETLVPGQLIECQTDWVLCHEITTPAALRMLEERGMDRVFNPDQIVAIPDHSVPAMNIKAAQMYQKLKSWVHEKGIKHFYDVGRGGIAHVVLENTGLAKPGQTLVSGDSHTCNAGALGMFATGVGSTDLAGAIYAGKVWFKVPESMLIRVNGTFNEGVSAKDLALEVIRHIDADGANYMVMEWVGDTIDRLDMEGRFTLTNMAIEAGGKTGIIAVDDTTRAYMAARKVTPDQYTEYTSDPDAKYKVVLDIDVSTLQPTVAFPHIPSNGREGLARLRGQLHQRAHLRPARGGAHPEGAHGCRRRADADRARHPAGLETGGAGRADGDLHRRRGHRELPQLRGLPGHAHRSSRAGRRVHFQHQPQLRGPHGGPNS